MWQQNSAVKNDLGNQKNLTKLLANKWFYLFLADRDDLTNFGGLFRFHRTKTSVLRKLELSLEQKL